MVTSAKLIDRLDFYNFLLYFIVNGIPSIIILFKVEQTGRRPINSGYF